MKLRIDTNIKYLENLVDSDLPYIKGYIAPPVNNGYLV